jgi:hypothetical protein
MRRLRQWSAAIALATVILMTGAIFSRVASAQDGEVAAVSDLTISLSESEISAFTGDRFTFTSEIANDGSSATPPLIANLAFVAIDGETYVDPEDWSPQRTMTVGAIRAGSLATQTWTVKPDLEGDVAIYVVALPREPELSTAAPLAVSPAIHLHVEEHRSLNPGGVLPVVLIVPAVLAVAFAGVRFTRNRR